MPKPSRRGLSEIARPTVVQLGSGSTNPFQPRRRRCSWRSGRCAATFTPGSAIGVSVSERKAAAVLMTGTARAYIGSSSRAASLSTAAKTMSRPPGSR